MEKKMVAYDVKHESFNVNPPSEISFLARNFDLDSFFSGRSQTFVVGF